MTVRDAVSAAAETLKHHSETPILDALVLLAAAMDSTKERVMASYPDDFEGGPARTFDAMLERRRAGHPVAYIIGKKEFYGFEFIVDPRVLIPRPDTEILVDAVLSSELANNGETPSILDVGTGSGCIAIALAANLPGARITASDSSEDALSVCDQNARAILGYPLMMIRANLLEGIAEAFDCIVSNPPYLTEDDWERAYGPDWPEPRSALAAGSDGLSVIRRLVVEAKPKLLPGGRLFIEASPSQMEEIRKIFVQTGFRGTTMYPDLSGRDRVIGAINE